MSRIKNSKILFVLLVTALLVGIASVPSKQSTTEIRISPISSASVTNGTIIFLNDTNIAGYAFPGDGSAENPWRFENYTLEYSFNSSSVGIHVENLTEYLIIRDSTLTNNNSEAFGTGIQILADNVVIENVTIENTFDGIHLEGENLSVNHTVVNAQNIGIEAIDCTFTNITNTNMTQSSYGIILESCNHTFIYDSAFAYGISGIQMDDCINFRIQENFIAENSFNGLLIVDFPPIKGGINIVTGNIFFKNGQHASVISEDVNTQFYDDVAKIGNYWDDWRGWGKYTVQKDVFDLYPLKNDLTVSPHFPFKFWFWIFAPTLIVLGAVGYFFYWKLVIQPTKE